MEEERPFQHETSALQFVEDACGVNPDKAKQLLKLAAAASSSIGNSRSSSNAHSDGNGGWVVERAIELFLQEQQTTVGTKRMQPSNASVSAVQTSPGPRKKQATLASFFGTKKDAVGGISNKLQLTQCTAPSTTPHPLAAESKNKNATSPATSIRDEKTSTDDSAIGKRGRSISSPSSSLSRKMVLGDSLDDNDDDPRLHYQTLVTAFSTMVATTKRNAKLAALETALTDIVLALGGIDDTRDRTRDSAILCQALQLVLGQTSSTLQISGSAVSRAVVAVTGVSSTQLREAYRTTGDMGDAAGQFMRNQRLLIKPKPLTITGVHGVLEDIASAEGKGSQQEKHALVVKLLRSCQSQELTFLVRTLLGNMRLGANIRTVLAALVTTITKLEHDAGTTTTLTPTSAAADAIKAVQDTFDFCPRLDKLSYALLCGGVTRMKETCVMEVGTPINPMLANPAHSLAEVEQLMMGSSSSSGGTGNDMSLTTTTTRAAVAEWKYDGMRCQAHYDGSSVKLFSRHMLETTEQFPDVVKALLEARKERTYSFIIDAEIVGVEENVDELGAVRLLPFQDLSTRRGSTDAAKQQVRIRTYVFDVMYLNDRPLAKIPLWKRQQLLRTHFCETNHFAFARSLALSTFDEKALTEFLHSAVQGGAEGLMIKLTGRETSSLVASEVERSIHGGSDQDDAKALCTYESGVRSQTWLKLKRDYVAGYADTIDVVPIGAWYGNGRKAQKQFLSPVLLAVYDEEEDVYRSICRCMSFTDAMYDAMRDFYLRGIPYPDGVGIVNDAVEQEQTTNDAMMKEQASNNGDGSDGSDGTAVVTRSNGNDEQDEAVTSSFSSSSFVNCYASRPSSAMFVTNESPPIWFKPMEVFEISFADLSLSKQHTAAQGLVHDPMQQDRGVALRFPRFKRRRPDKRCDQATTTVQIAQLFAKQIKTTR